MPSSVADRRPIAAIAASESKVAFMSALGFKAGKSDGERLYKLMKEEAVQEYRKIIQDKRTQSPEFERDNHASPRYAYTQIDKSTIHKAITSIYNRAGPETKAVYDRGRDPAGDSESNNWIIRWMLYHCFRYRDGRNKRPSVTSMTQEDRASASSTDEQPMLAMFAHHHDPTTFWHEPPRQPLGSNRDRHAANEPGGDRPLPGRPLPYDPVRAC